jgi:hypothetical protein
MADPALLLDRQILLGNALVAGWPKLNIPGIPRVSAAAAVGNATEENSCRSVTTGTLDHGSNGLLQWRLDRLTGDGVPPTPWGMQPWCIKNFGTWQDIVAQAAFFSYECMRDYKTLWADLVAGKESLATLTLNITDIYERPSVAGRVPDTRIGYAINFLNEWPTTAAPTPPVIPAPLPQPTSTPTPAPLPAPAPIPMPLPTPSVQRGTLMDPAVIAVLAPIIEALAAGFLKAIITQVTAASVPGATTTVITTAPPPVQAPTATLDIGSLASTLQSILLPSLTTALSSSLPGLIATEIGKIISVPPGVKP